MKLTRSTISAPYDHPITLCVHGRRFEGAQLISISCGVVHKLWIRYQDDDYFFEESEIEELHVDP